jgi:fumarylacetoacetase
MLEPDQTHDPSVASWVESANRAGCDFPLQNLPFGIFRRRGRPEGFRVGVAIGSAIVDLSHASVSKLLAPDTAQACRAGVLNELMAMGSAASGAIRRALWNGLQASSPARGELAAALVEQSDAELAMPARVGDFTDFFSSLHHATATGRLFRPDQPLLPNYKWLPVAYHGRTSTVDISDVPVRRPRGQVRNAGGEVPVVVPTRRLDYELELGVFVGRGNDDGAPIALASAWEHVFGVVLLNDWSARDIQAWESQPLGPFLAKNFATRISPWVVTSQALAPFRTALVRPAGDPAPLPYLHDARDAAAGALDIRLEARIRTEAMQGAGLDFQRLSSSNSSDAYWTVAQLLAHHTVNGCRLRAGDLIGTGTLSGPGPMQGGCLLELTRAGQDPIEIVGGERRTFLEDGDEVELRGVCERPGRARIGLGVVRGRVIAVS